MFPTGFKPLLASEADLAKLKYPVWVSGKLDGIRCFISDGVAYSRTLKPLPNLHIQSYFADGAHDGLDGEILVGDILAKDVMQASQSGVMRVEGQPDFTFMVFDNYELHSKPFVNRYMQAGLIVKELNFAHYKQTELVEHYLAQEEATLMQLEEQHVEEGYEGVMLRSPDKPYKFGRASTNSQELLKVKRFQDDEAVILAAEPKMHNANEAEKDAFGRTKRSSKQENLVALDTLGAIQAITKAGIEFSIGTGFDDAERARLWKMHKEGKLAGQLVKYKHQPSGADVAPRFPSYLGLRHPDDIS